MLEAIGRVYNNNKLYGYVLKDTHTNNRFVATKEEIIRLGNIVNNLKISKNGKVTGTNGTDLRNLPIRKLHKKEIYKDEVSIDYYNGIDYFSGKSLIDGIDMEKLPNKHRSQLNDICRFLGKSDNMLLGIIGLRRTGKSILIQQAIKKLVDSGINTHSILYIRIGRRNVTMGTVVNIIREHIKKGVKYIFIDEITMCKGFISYSKILADSLAILNVRIVISGTDSLMFEIAQQYELLGRMEVINTGIITYKEHTEILGHTKLYDYLKMGGNLVEHSFRNSSTLKHFVNSSIAHNIYNSISDADYYYGKEQLDKILKDKQECVNLIYRLLYNITESLNIQHIKRDISLRVEMSSLSGNINKQFDKAVRRSIYSNALNLIDREVGIIDIPNINKEQLSILLDYLCEMNVLDYVDNIAGKDREYFLNMPGMRYIFTTEFLSSLYKNEELIKKLESNIGGYLLEGVIARDIKYYGKDKSRKVYKLRIEDTVEVNIVVKNTDGNYTNTYELYEVKYSNKIKSKHMKNLVGDNLKLIEKTLGNGKVVSRNVIYNGETQVVNGINFINAEEFLLGLK